MLKNKSIKMQMLVLFLLLESVFLVSDTCINNPLMYTVWVLVILVTTLTIVRLYDIEVDNLKEVQYKLLKYNNVVELYVVNVTSPIDVTYNPISSINKDSIVYTTYVCSDNTSNVAMVNGGLQGFATSMMEELSSTGGHHELDWFVSKTLMEVPSNCTEAFIK